MSEPRAYTTEEIRKMFLDTLHMQVSYWTSLKKPTKETCEGLVHSILCIFDGVNAGLPAFAIAPLPHKDDMNYHIEEGSNYFPPNHDKNIKGDIGGNLHEQWYKKN